MFFIKNRANFKKIVKYSSFNQDDFAMFAYMCFSLNWNPQIILYAYMRLGMFENQIRIFGFAFSSGILSSSYSFIVTF